MANEEQAPAPRPARRRRAGRRDFGTIKADGMRFSARWYEGGKRRHKRGFKTRTEAEAFLSRIRTAMADGGSAASTGDSTIADLSLLGLPICDALHLSPLCDPPPNTDLLNAPLGTLIRLNEQRCEHGGTALNRRDGSGKHRQCLRR